MAVEKTKNADREIITVRTFRAPRELVFEMFTSPLHLSRWWGPNGFTTVTHGFDFRPGGVWLLTMRGPDGTEFPNRLVYEEIVVPERIVCSHQGHKPGDPPQFRHTITFAVRGDQTEVTMHMLFPSAEARDTVVKKYHAIEGAEQTLARLGQHLASDPASLPLELKMSRVLSAPKKLVFEAWSNKEHFSRWFAPRPLTMPSADMDFRPGGKFNFVMRTPDGVEFPSVGEFVDIVPNERIVFRGKLEADLEVNTTVTFAEHEGRTMLSVHQTYSRRSPHVAGAYAGWTATLNQFEEEVAMVSVPNGKT